jgi:MFS family permease
MAINLIRSIKKILLGIQYFNMWNLLKKHPRQLSFTVLLAFFGGFAQTYVLSFFNEGISADLKLSNEAISFVYSCATFLASLTLPYFGKLIDRSPVKRVALIMGFIFIGASLSLANAFSLLTLFVSYFLMRAIGQVAIGLVGSTYITRNFGKNRGKALSISSMGRAVSHGILPVIVTALIVKYGWRSGAYFFVAASLFLYLPLVLFFLNKHEEKVLYEDNDSITHTGLKKKTVKELFKSHFIYFLSFGNSIIPFLMTGIFFQQGYMRESNNWSMEIWAQSFLVFASFQIFFNFISGYVIDKFSARSLLPVKLIPFLIGVICMQYLSGDYVCYLFLGLSGASVGLSANARAAFMGECFDNDNLGFIKSIDSTFMVISTSIAPILFSYIYKFWGFSGFLNLTYSTLVLGVMAFTYCALVIKKY